MVRLAIHSALWATFLGVTGVGTASASSIRTASELCPEGMDPCVVTREVEVAAGSRLDFGRRTLVVADRGVLDFGAGDAEVSCGRLDVSGASPAVLVRGPGPDGRSAGGNVVFAVYGHCTADPSTRCFVDASCASLGAGACEHATATATLRSAVAGSAARPGRFALRAAGDVVVDAVIAMASSTATGDGGGIAIESTKGSVHIGDRLDATGGGQAAGGQVEILAALDAALGARVDASGGDLDGGDVTIVAERDAVMADDVRVESTAGAGAGGDVTVLAGGDLHVLGGSASDPVEFAADGHQSADGRGGDGGSVALEAVGQLRVDCGARVAASGAPPDGFADLVSLRGAAGLSFNGRVLAGAKGTFGGGGLVVAESDAAIALGSCASFDLRGAAGGGDLVLRSGTDLRSDAGIDVSAGIAGFAGRILASAGSDVVAGGTWTTAGAASAFSRGELSVEGCRVELAGTWRNAAASGVNRVVAREALAMASTASLSATGARGENRFVHRSATPAPVLEGRCEPPLVLVADASLPACAACDASSTPTAEGCAPEGLCRRVACVGESCSAIFERRASVPALTVRVRRRRGVAVASWRGTMPLAGMPVDPTAASVRFVIVDAVQRPVFDATLPSGALVRTPRSWRFRADNSGEEQPVRRATLAIDGRSSVAVWRVAIEGNSLADAIGAGSLAVAWAFGEATGTLSCVSSPPLDCRPGRRALRCRSTPA